MIAIRQVTKNFGAHPALRGITLDVGPGEVVALVGPNGAGKSTTLRVLTGALRPDSGAASIDGHDVSQDGARARRGLGYLPQKLGMPEDTVVRDLLALVATLRGIAPAHAVGAINTMRLGHRLDARLGELSGGERQRVMLALATVGQTRALVLDEPSISLDSEGAEDVREAIRRAAADGAAVLFASHHLSDVAVLADRIVLMVDGRMAAQGSLRELALLAGLPAEKNGRELPAIERVYHALVARARRGDPLPSGTTRLQGAA